MSLLPGVTARVLVLSPWPVTLAAVSDQPSPPSGCNGPVSCTGGFLISPQSMEFDVAWAVLVGPCLTPGRSKFKASISRFSALVPSSARRPWTGGGHPDAGPFWIRALWCLSPSIFPSAVDTSVITGGSKTT